MVLPVRALALDPALLLVPGGTVIAGIDTHTDTLAVAVITATGRVTAQCQLPNTEVGFDDVEVFLADTGVARVGIEGSGNYGRDAALRLVLTGTVQVLEVPPSLTSRERSAVRVRHRLDPERQERPS